MFKWILAPLKLSIKDTLVFATLAPDGQYRNHNST